MASPQLRRHVTAAALVVLAAWGAYTTYGVGFQNGLFDTIRASLDVENPYVPGGVSPLRTRYVASPAIDKHITILISFFSYVIDLPRTKNVDVTSLLVMGQLCAGWTLIRFEGWRLANKRKVIAWTTVIGLFMQFFSPWAITVPIYLLVQLYTSPIANPEVGPNFVAVAADPVDLLLLPFSSIISFIVPAIMMWWPGLDAYSHYGWDFTWQIFPMREYAVALVCKFVLKRILSPQAGGGQYLKNSRKAYDYALFVACSVQLLALAACFTPASLAPAKVRPWVAASSLQNVFSPAWPWASPSVGPSALINGNGLADLSKLFLQWDILTGNTALMLWGLHMHRRAVPNATLASRLRILGTWIPLGGPVAAAAALLRDRDHQLAFKTAVRKAGEVAAVSKTSALKDAKAQ